MSLARIASGVHLPPTRCPAALLAAAEGVTRYAGKRRPWRAHDTEIMAELDRRCWSWRDIQGWRFWRFSTWLEAGLVRVTPKRTIGRPVWERLLAAVVEAQRQGAAGLRLSLEELATLCGVCRRTVARWTEAMEAQGLLRIIRTRALRDDGGTVRARSVYLPGPAIDRPAIREGLGDPFADDDARAARRERRESWVARFREIWQRQRLAGVCEAIVKGVVTGCHRNPDDRSHTTGGLPRIDRAEGPASQQATPAPAGNRARQLAAQRHQTAQGTATRRSEGDRGSGRRDGSTFAAAVEAARRALFDPEPGPA